MTPEEGSQAADFASFPQLPHFSSSSTSHLRHAGVQGQTSSQRHKSFAMNTAAPTTSWSQPEPFNAISTMENQDFSNLVDLDAVTFDFDFDGIDGYEPQTGNGRNSIDPNLFATSAQQQHGVLATHQTSAPHTMGQQTPTIFDLNMNLNYDGQPFAMQSGSPMGHHQMVPPTPNSIEMHADAARYLQQMDAQNRAIMEHYQMRKAEAMNNFTPLGTPAVTPHEGQFNLNSEFTVPGAYFSPLTSPALEGQQQHNGQHTSASSVATASPIDHDVDMLGESAIPSQPATRKTRKRTSAPRANGGSRKVAQSPIQKPTQRKKQALSSTIHSKEMTELLEATSQSCLSPTSPRINRTTQNYASSESISPEPLSEGIMGPPPKPGSAKPSPAMLARSPNFQQNIPTGHSPATPASLMRLPHSSGEVNGAVAVPSPICENEGDIPMLEELTLPEAVVSEPKRPGLTRIDTAGANGDATPRMGARKALKSGPLSTPTTSGPSTMRPTPIGSAVTSPTNGSASPVIAKKTDTRGRVSKKRGSMSGTVPLSPALRPKMSQSPNIQPLLPEGGVFNDQDRTRLLATRSNYQNLIEGTNIPGVSYPSDLPTQLTSKRTSHKIAEQGRRQRINIALQEMQKLLPRMSPMIGEKNNTNDDEDDEDDDEDGGKRKGSGSGGGKGGGNSKAATVESAIVYIKSLQAREKKWEEESEVKERRWKEGQQTLQQKNDELMRKLMQLEKKLTTGSTGGEAMTTADEDD